MAEVLMPRLSDSMEEGTVVRWLKSDGDEVSRGEEIVEIETDKATMAYEADASGRLSILQPAGSTLPVGSPIGLIGTATPDQPADPGGDGTVDGRGSVGGGRSGPGASPVARRLAAAHGLAIEAIQGSGPNGRILKADVAAAASGSPAAPAAPEAGAAAPAPPVVPPAPAAEPATTSAAPAAPATRAMGEVEIRELTRAQTVVARRMAESRATVPNFELRTDVAMDSCVALRGQLKDRAGNAPVPSLNDFVVRACALALREHPKANGSYRDGRFELHERVNIGVAVSADDALVVPTVFDADRKSLGTIAGESRALAERVRSRTITPPELAGGTFTVSNLGMFGITSFTAVINAPQAAILAVGAVVPRPVVRDDAIVIGQVMDLTLSCDHRILYGADAARFLARVRELLEDPFSLLL